MSGIFLNEKRLDTNQSYPLSHYDKLKIGQNICLLIHIHNGTTTCIGCEPGKLKIKLKISKEKNKFFYFLIYYTGEVIAKLNKEKANSTPKVVANKASLEKSRRAIKKALKKKF
jgi:hypothetical protein